MGEWVICIMCKASSVSMDTTPYWRGMLLPLGSNGWRITFLLQYHNDPRHSSQFVGIIRRIKYLNGILLVTAWPAQSPELSWYERSWSKEYGNTAQSYQIKPAKHNSTMQVCRCFQNVLASVCITKELQQMDIASE